MKSKLMMLVVLVVAVSVQAGLVPNGDFQTIYQDNGTTSAAYITDGTYFGIGSRVIKNHPVNDPREATYADGTTGQGIVLPGWIPVLGTNSDVMQAGDWGGPDGSGDMAFLCFAGWGGPTTITSANPLFLPALNAGEAYELSADIFNHGSPVVLELLVDGAVVAPDGESTPAQAKDTWVEFTRTYSSLPLGDVTIYVGTRQDDPAADPQFTGNRASVDNVDISIVPEPATMALLALGGLALRRRRKA